MTSKYLIRFDDLCPTMNWDMWSRIESVLLEHKISPLLAVVPDNQDRKVAGAREKISGTEFARFRLAAGAPDYTDTNISTSRAIEGS